MRPKQIVYHEDKLIRAYYNRDPTSKFVPADLGSSEIHHVRQFARRQLKVMRQKGIPENEAGRLFNAYSDISSVPTAGESSTGLGLAICKTIVQQHKGSIGITPGRNKGCHFFFTVPTAR